MRILKLLTLLAMLAGIGAAQCGKMVPNPLTGLQDCVGTGGGGSGSSGGLNGTGVLAVCVNSTAAPAASLPATNAPQAVCESDGTQAYLDFSSAATQTAYGRLTLPNAWSGNLYLFFEGYATTVTAQSITVSLSCINAGTATASPTYGTAQTITFVPAATSGLTQTRTTLTTNSTYAGTACANNSLMRWKIIVVGNTSADLRALTLRFDQQ